MVDQREWDEEFDVIVAGGGGAGLLAAIEAAERGCMVLLVEKQPDPGGATAMAVGSITAAGTALQRAAGIVDDPDAHYADLLTMIGAGRDRFDLDLSRLLVDCAPHAVARLIALGVRFSGPHPEVPHTRYRMHNVAPQTPYLATLLRAAEARGVVIRTNSAIAQIQRDEASEVAGLTLRQGGDQQTHAVRVCRGLVLATGDFSANDELARAHGRPAAISAIEPIRPYATGDGITLALAIGADAVNLDRSGGPNFRTIVPPYLAPERSLLREGGVLVNRAGRRFCNELLSPELASNGQPDKSAFLIFDAQLAARIATAADDTRPGCRDGWYTHGKLFISTFPGVAYGYLDDYRARGGCFAESATLTDLAGALDIDPRAFLEDIAVFNRAAAGESADAFGRERLGPGVNVPPFYAIGPIKPFNVFSAGGLKVDRLMHVLDTRGKLLPRLYAAGANGEAGVFLGGHGHHLAWAFGTGMIAGRTVATEQRR